MEHLDTDLLRAVQQNFLKQAFVPMPGGQTEPVAGASAMTAGMGAPMGDPSMQGGGMPPGGDPSMQGGGMPMPPGGDPAMMGVDPMTGMPMGADPAMMGGGMPPEGAGEEGGDPLQEIVEALKEELLPEIEKIVQAAIKSIPAPAAAPAAPKEPKAAPAPEPESAGEGDKMSDLIAAVSENTALIRQALGG